MLYILSIELKRNIESSIILLLFIILEIGIQYSNYQINQSKHTQSSQMVGFIERAR
ncbi:MAG: DUF3290 family protein [Streptococcus salivarius]